MIATSHHIAAALATRTIMADVTENGTLNDKPRVEELPSDDSNSDYEDLEDATETNGPSSSGKQVLSEQPPPVQDQLPPWLQDTILSLFHDDLTTTTTESQTKVTQECLPLLTGKDTQDLPLNSHGLPHLRREAHATFLRNTLEPLPSAYQMIDASRPWVFCWALTGLSVLGEDVTVYAERLRETARPMQHPQGGFGGGYGQIAHCACSYALILALATTGTLDVVDRKAMWHWLGQIKRSDGGFCMAIGAEEDIRGAYCALTILALLNLPLELPQDAPARKDGLQSFTDRLGEWIGRCQTYEGGIGGAPTNEAHGAYAFCALASLCILDAPSKSIPKYLDAPALSAWLAARQTTPEGGFAGRQEKLVDACYSHWVGGCFALLEAALSPAKSTTTNTSIATSADPSLWNRAALIRYLLCCAQQPGQKGGMRDKPSTRPDSYHTAYSLVGLSHAQNRFSYTRSEGATRDGHTAGLMAAFNWTSQPATGEEFRAWQLDAEDIVHVVHPVFVIPFAAVEAAKAQFPAGGI